MFFEFYRSFVCEKVNRFVLCKQKKSIEKTREKKFFIMNGFYNTFENQTLPPSDEGGVQLLLRDYGKHHTE